MPSRAFTASRRQLTALRLSALGIAQPNPAAATGAAETVRAQLALQGQDFPGLLWSIGLRSMGETLASITAAHEAGQFVRTWPMRGTLHAITPADLAWLLALTGERQIRAAAGRHRQLELTPADFVRADEVARAVLANGAIADRATLLAAFAEAGVAPTGQRGVHLLAVLAQSGTIVLTGKTTYALFETVLPAPPPEITSDDVLRTLALRYATSHGPVTARDLAWWSGLTLTDARAGLAAAAFDLEVLVVDGIEYFHAPGLQPAESGVHLLPGFDEYLLGYTDRSAQLSAEYSERIVPGGNGMFLSTIVVDGEVVGTWRRNRSRDRVEVTLEPFDSLRATVRRRMRPAVARYSDFLELPVTVAD